jgi:hypothetical protein
MNLNDFYVLVDTENKEIIDKFQNLPTNWKNIASLSGLSDEKLEDLKWAGHHNLGWINLTSSKIKDFKMSPENLELNKNTLKVLISEQRKEKQDNPIEYKNAKIKTDLKTRYSLFLIKNSEKQRINFKCINGYFTFTHKEIVDVYNLIENKIQRYFDDEMKIYQKIDKCQSISDLTKINT